MSCFTQRFGAVTERVRRPPPAAHPRPPATARSPRTLGRWPGQAPPPRRKQAHHWYSRVCARRAPSAPAAAASPPPPPRTAPDPRTTGEEESQGCRVRARHQDHLGEPHEDRRPRRGDRLHPGGAGGVDAGDPRPCRPSALATVAPAASWSRSPPLARDQPVTTGVRVCDKFPPWGAGPDGMSEMCHGLRTLGSAHENRTGPSGVAVSGGTAGAHGGGSGRLLRGRDVAAPLCARSDPSLSCNCPEPGRREHHP